METTNEESAIPESSEPVVPPPPVSVTVPSSHDAILAELTHVKSLVKALLITTIVLSSVIGAVVVIGLGARIIDHHDSGRPPMYQQQREQVRPGGGFGNNFNG